MRISLAQIHAVTGDISANIVNHKKFIALAVQKKSDMIVFPELSLTSYEPALAKALATAVDDSRFDDFQQVSNDHRIVIGVGMPTKNIDKPSISMLIFQPGQPRSVYSKKFLHPDEEEFFVSGSNFPVLGTNGERIALAICYEISVPEHLTAAQQEHPTVYVASVAKFTRGIDKAHQQLSATAKQHRLITAMSNCVGYADGAECAGRTSAWNSEGALLAQLDDQREGVLTLDTDTTAVTMEQW
jgi:predicted amidohydrolase